MRRGRTVSIVAGLLLALVLVGAVVRQWEAMAAWWRHRTVKKLMDPAQREGVYKQIVEWQRYRGVPRYAVNRVTTGEGIHNVIVCPQRDGRPFYVVVFRESYGKARPFELVDFDGTLVPIFEGHNVDTCDFKDLNADEVPDRLYSEVVQFKEAKESVVELTLIPMTPEQKLALRVVYRVPRGDAGWAWTVFETNDGLPEIRLGPRDPVTNDLLPRAVYRWDPSRSEYVGPTGGIDQDFLRVDDDDEKVAEFALHEG